MEKSIFEKIAEGEIPAEVIWQNDDFLAFLDIRPMVEGHTLVIPKKNPGDYIFAMEDGELSGLMVAAKEVAKLLEGKLDCDRCLVWVEGFEVPHVHVHLLPAKRGVVLSELKSHEPAEGELKAVKEKILG